METFTQSKLTRSEWISIEKPIDEKEKVILRMIYNGVQNKDPIFVHNTISNVVHLDHEEKDYYIYVYLLKTDIDALIKLFSLTPIPVTPPKKKLNSADKIRIENQKKKLNENIEMTIIQIAVLFFKDYQNKKINKELYLYNLCYLINTYSINKYLKIIIDHIIDKYIGLMDVIYFLENVNKFIEINPIFDYKPITLYQHQTDIFNIFKTKTDIAKLVFYRAPTSSGKTLTPIGLCGAGYKVIFMCASRHIGLSLAKHAINAGVRVAFSLGCDTADDIRLHYSAVSDYILKANGKKKPDNSKGQKVDLMICDIQSYEIAMLYMLSFFENENIILVMDEPTISMDYEEHPIHRHISKLWSINTIKQIILSSATLPNREEMEPLIHKFEVIHTNCEIHYIDTIDETTNITLLDNTGNVIMPHNVFTTTEEINTFITIHGKTHFKFLSIVECSIFILYVCRNVFKSEKMITEYFTYINDINIKSIRNLYYNVLKKIKSEDLAFIISSYSSFRNTKKCDVGIDITTKQAYTLTYGPAIFFCKNISDWCDYFIKNSGIHVSAIEELNKIIDYNNDLFTKITKKQKLVEDKTAKDEDNENKIKEQRFDPEVKKLLSEIEIMEKMFKPLKLNSVDIPNTRDHFMRWTNLKYETSNVFTSNIDASYVKRIMTLTIDTKYKILLLMGIGIFNPEEHMGEYNDIMKELAENKYLLCILATPDYIYGTNYQLCHAILTEEMTEHITQEKIIQAIGRVGRREKNKLFRFIFKNNSIIKKLFIKDNLIESHNMNILFF
jgi:hypothetical protein